MKIRQGFVSNSSTSSFCIYGAAIEGDWTTILKSLKKNCPEKFEKFKADTILDCNANEPPDGETDEVKEWIENIDEASCDPDGIYEIDPALSLEKLFKEEGLSVRAPYEWETIYIGRSWSGVKDDETGAQFKKSIENAVKNAMGNNVTCSTHSASYQS